jgi:uncharacterized protein (DUF2147 family)
MKRLSLALMAIFVTAAPASATARGNLEGHWKNGKMEISIAPCGRSLCGTVVKASPRQRERAQSGSGTALIGARVISDIRPAGPQTYRANVYLADRDMNASGTIREINQDRLELRGCVLAVICKTTHWDRISR